MEPTLSIPGIIGGVIAAAVGLATFYGLMKTHPELRLPFVALIIVLAALGWAWLAGANVSLPPEPVVVPPPPEPSSAPQPRPTATSMPDRQPLPQVVWLAVPGVGDVAAFRISQTEVTNGQYAQCVQAGQCRAPQITDEYDRPQFRDFPVVHVTRAQAREYAAWLGAALPTEAQWLLACRGDDGRTHPWGSEPPDANLANYDSIIGRTTAVGFYGAGASPSGALDMVGNVWEWVEPDDQDEQRLIQLGGAYDTPAQNAACDARFETSLAVVGTETGGRSTGFRVVAPEAPPLPPSGEAAPINWRPVAAVGDQPGFRISETEITNEQYAACVAAGACTPPAVPADWAARQDVPDQYRQSRFGDPDYAAHPVVWVTPGQAREFAAWADGWLPTEAQWLRACQGDDQRRYPWGDADPDTTRANFYQRSRDTDPEDGDRGDTTAVGRHPAGGSPYGALDMAGNVWEWVDAERATTGPVARGGAFNDDAGLVGCLAATTHSETSASTIGFRVAKHLP